MNSDLKNLMLFVSNVLFSTKMDDVNMICGLWSFNSHNM